MTFDGVPPGWTVTANPAELSLEPGQAGDLAVNIAAPAQSPEGTYMFTVTATSAGYAGVSSSEQVAVEFSRGRPAR